LSGIFSGSIAIRIRIVLSINAKEVYFTVFSSPTIKQKIKCGGKNKCTLAPHHYQKVSKFKLFFSPIFFAKNIKIKRQILLKIQNKKAE